MNKEKKLMTDHALNSWESNHEEEAYRGQQG